MQAQPVDPRDERWEVSRPVYRVHFWERTDPERADGGWISEEWRLEDADVDEVLAWAHARAAGRRFAAYAEVMMNRPDDLGRAG